MKYSLPFKKHASRRCQRGYILNPFRFGGAGGGDGTWGGTPPPAPAPTPGADRYFFNTVLLLRMNGAEAGTSFTDLSTHGRTVTRLGTAVTTLQQSRFGNGSLSASTAGSGLSVAYARELSFKDAVFIMEGWAYSDALSGIGTIADFRGSGAANTGWAITIDYFNHTLNVYDGATATNVVSSPISSVPGPGAWYYWTVTRNSAGVVSVYIDGEPKASATYNPPVTDTTGIRFATNYAGADNFKGYLGGMRFTNAVARVSSAFATPTEEFPNIQYYEATPTSEPYYHKNVLHLHFDGADNGTVFTDSSSYARPATLVGTPKTATGDRVFGTAAGVFNGTTDMVTFPSDLSLNFGSDSFFIEARVKMTSYAGNNGGYYITNVVAKDGIGLAAREFEFGIRGTATSYQFIFFTGFRTNDNYNEVNAAFDFKLNIWYDIAVGRIGDLFYFFVNGILLNPAGAAFTGALQATSTPLKVAGLMYDATYKYLFPGKIDELRITRGMVRQTTHYAVSPAPFAHAVTVYDPGGSGQGYTPPPANADLTDWAKTELQILSHLGFVDTSRAKNTATVNLTNAPLVVNGPITPKWGNSCIKMEANSVIAVTNSAGCFIYYGEFEISFFIYLTAYPAAGSWAGLVQLGDEIDKRFLWRLKEDGSILLNWYGVGESSGTTRKIPLNRWAHVCLSRQGTNMLVSIDGETEIAWNGCDDIVGNNSKVIFRNHSTVAYWDSIRVTAGRSLITSHPQGVSFYTPPQSQWPENAELIGDPYWKDVLLYLPLDGDTDDKGPRQIPTLSNPGAYTFETDGAYGSHRLQLTSTGGGLCYSLNQGMSTENWTFEMIWRANATTGDTSYVVFDDAYYFQAQGGGNFYIYDQSNFYNFASGPALNTFHRICLMRCGRRFHLWVDGAYRGNVITALDKSWGTVGKVRIGGISTSGGIIASYDDVRLTLGNRYTGAGRGAPDPHTAALGVGSLVPNTDLYKGYTVLHLRGDNINEPAVFVDSSPRPKAIQRHGDAYNVSEPQAYGGGAILLPNFISYLTTPRVYELDMFTGHCTMELEFYLTGDGLPDSSGNRHVALFTCNNTSDHTASHLNSMEFALLGDANKTGVGVYLRLVNASQQMYVIRAPYNFLKNTRYHLAISRDQRGYVIYVNGVSVPFSENTVLMQTINLSTNPVWIGRSMRGNEIWNFPGYMDNIRWTRVVGRYTKPFPPGQTGAWPVV